MAFSPRLKLNNGTEIPVLGLGTWKMHGHEAEQAVSWALELGYRHIDTARIYFNEHPVGRAIRDSGIPRKDIFITTKIFNHQHHHPVKALDGSLRRLGLDYVDLYLIHFPVPPRNRTWKILEKQHQLGKCKAIGVSNFTIRHLEELLKIADIVPAINQVEFSPFLYQKELLEYCKSKGIIVEAYSPLTHGQRLQDPTIQELAKKYVKTPAQIALRWCVQHGTVVLPKSAHQQRIAENANIFDFEISSADMRKLDGLNQDFRAGWDPSNIP